MVTTNSIVSTNREANVNVLSHNCLNVDICFSSFNEIINTIWKASLHIYTDGSVDTKINVAGCSMFHISN